MESFLVAYIAQRMADLGFQKYSYEPLVIILSNDQNEYLIEGMNEYYYLTTKALTPGTEISAGNNYFKVEDYYVNLDLSKVQEFTGQIKITFPQGGKQALEFIRVIPQYPESKPEQKQSA
ncbi:MAG TPA: hypothetical protein VIH57_23820 [Bacteroidales bacterium]